MDYTNFLITKVSSVCVLWKIAFCQQIIILHPLSPHRVAHCTLSQGVPFDTYTNIPMYEIDIYSDLGRVWHLCVCFYWYLPSAACGSLWSIYIICSRFVWTNIAFIIEMRKNSDIFHSEIQTSFICMWKNKQRTFPCWVCNIILFSMTYLSLCFEAFARSVGWMYTMDTCYAYFVLVNQSCIRQYNNNSLTFLNK